MQNIIELIFPIIAVMVVLNKIQIDRLNAQKRKLTSLGWQCNKKKVGMHDDQPNCSLKKDCWILLSNAQTSVQSGNLYPPVDIDFSVWLPVAPCRMQK